MKPTIAVVEDNHAFQYALVKLIGESNEFLLGGVYSSAEQAMELVHKPADVVIVDIQLQGKSGIELIRELRQKNPVTYYLICSNHDDDEKIVSALENGAHGYILKDSTSVQIKEAILEMLHGGAPMSPYIARRVITFFRKPPKSESVLTERESEVLELLAKGLLYKEIAATLCISFETVKKHLKNIYQKLHVQNKVEALNKFRLL